MKYVLLVSALLLGGCAHGPPTRQEPVARHLKEAGLKRVPAKEFEKANPTPTPAQKTFKRKWLRLFFRERAAGE